MITKMWNILIGTLVLVLCCYGSGVSCQTVCHALTAVEGQNVTLDCGFKTTVEEGNLKWAMVSTDGDETEVGHIVPGNTACGTDTVDCALHKNGSITLVSVTEGDGGKYRCLRGDAEGYHYFSDFKLTVLPKGANNPPVITIKAEPKVKSFTMGSYGVVHIYENPVCEDKEDGTGMVTCYPPSGVIMDKKYDQIHCNCTDSDGNSDSVHLNVDSHADLKDNCLVPIILSVVLGIVLLVVAPLNIYQECFKSRNKESTRNGATKQNNTCAIEEGERAPLKQDGDMSVMRQQLAEKEAECAEKSGRISELEEMNKKKDVDMSDMRQKLAEKEDECVKKSGKIDELEQMNQKKYEDIQTLQRDLKAVEEKYHAADKELAVKEEELRHIKAFHQAELKDKTHEQKDDKELESHLPSSEQHISGEDSDSGKQKKKKKKRDPERRLTQSGQIVQFPKDEAPDTTFDSMDGKDKSQVLDDGGINASMTSGKSGFDEQDFGISKCLDDSQPWKEFWIDEDQLCKGFDLTFICDRPGLTINVTEDEESENICSIAFEDCAISYKCDGRNKSFPYTPGETKYRLTLGQNKTQLRFYGGSSKMRCIETNADMCNRNSRMLYMYKNNTCNVFIEEKVNLVEDLGK